MRIFKEDFDICITCEANLKTVKFYKKSTKNLLNQPNEL